ncbi:MAG TPA: DPP IV N-terminal domain-containing protein, partial [Actinomycetes bacterium]|nr:DPP IV N-terminal domain-containing protein [Actinomycetes bacterium]
MTQVSYPRLSARTQHFTLGRPRSFSISPDGTRVLFVRSGSGTDRVGRLWTLDLTPGDTFGHEEQLVDPASLLAGGDEDLSPQERARRERMRESAGGIVGYATDETVSTAVFALSGRVFVIEIASGDTRELPVRVPAIDPRVDPTGSRVSYASSGAIRVIEVDGTGDRELVAAESEDVADVVWGLANFVAAEELDRSRGLWWSPDGSHLIAERYDESDVVKWQVSNPTNPEQPSVTHRYPAAGTNNPAVSLWLIAMDGKRHEISFDHSDWEYVAAVHWSKRGKPLVQVLERSQTQAVVLSVDDDGEVAVMRSQTDSAWVDVNSGVPAWGPSGQLLTIEVVDDTYALCADGASVTPMGLQVSAVIDVGPDDVLFVAR